MLSDIEKQDRAKQTLFEQLNPYRGCEKVPDGSRRVNCNIGTRDHEFIIFLRGALEGTTSTTIGVFWSKLCSALRDLGIVDVTDRLRFEQFIEQYKIVLPNHNEHENGYDQGYTAGYRDATNNLPARKLRLSREPTREPMQGASTSNDTATETRPASPHSGIAGQQASVQKVVRAKGKRTTRDNNQEHSV